MRNSASSSTRDNYGPRAAAAWLVMSLGLIVLTVQMVSPTRARDQEPRVPTVKVPTRSGRMTSAPMRQVTRSAVESALKNACSD